MLSLPEQRRMELLQRLLRSFHSDRGRNERRIARLWADEAVCRDREMDTAQDPGVTADEVFERLRTPGR